MPMRTRVLEQSPLITHLGRCRSPSRASVRTRTGVVCRNRAEKAIITAKKKKKHLKRQKVGDTLWVYNFVKSIVMQPKVFGVALCLEKQTLATTT